MLVNSLPAALSYEDKEADLLVSLTVRWKVSAFINGSNLLRLCALRTKDGPQVDTQLFTLVLKFQDLCAVYQSD